MEKKDNNKQIELIFESLKKQKSNTFPKHGELREYLSTKIADRNIRSKKVEKKVLTLFASSAIEMWQRAVHSFMISSSITSSSPIWSSVIGYYSSHYSIRAFAHTLGYFQLYQKRCNIKLEIVKSQYICNIEKKGNDGEHKYYWKKVQAHELFIDNPFFTINDELKEQSDSGHRNKANYFDNINIFPTFKILDEEYLKNRIDKISKMEFSDVPIPRVDKFPDIDFVQIMAYHRLVYYRAFLDNILTNKNNFWNINRNPSWCKDYLNYQVVNPSLLETFNEKI